MYRRKVSVDLNGKTALVTGGAKGIGEAISLALAANGAALALNYCSSGARAREMAAAIEADGGRAVCVQADVAEPDEVKRMVREAEAALGDSIDILVNNAGTQVELSTIDSVTPELWQKVLAVNLTGAMVCSQCVAAGMREKGWGRIINISSISARSGGGPGGIPYATAKGGLNTFTKGLAKELGPTGVTVNAIAPGVILTEMHEKFSTKEGLDNLKDLVPLKRLGEPEDVSGVVLFLTSDSASYVTGEIIAVNGGLRMD